MKLLGSEIALNIIVAVDKNGVFGANGEIPWKDEPFAKDDFKRFQQITKDSICIMGYKTYLEILEMKTARAQTNNTSVDPNEPLLKGRECYVITNTPQQNSGMVKFNSGIREIVQDLSDDEIRKVFILGGEKVFIEALPWTSTIYMTLIDREYSGEKIFPVKYVEEYFKIVEGDKTEDLKFLTLQRIKY
jgi:dihydrofolate reductase